MIEIAMYIALGALAAGLVALAIVPAIWKRAVHLTQRRIAATVPLDVEEIRAEKDRMRAEFALTIRRMEKKLDSEREASANRRIEINNQSEDLQSALAERDSKADAVLELEERERVLRAELRSREEELVRVSSTLREAERKLVNRDNEIAILKGDTPQPESSFAFLSGLVEDDDSSLEELDAKTVRREYKAVKREFDAAKIRIATLENELDSTRAALQESKDTADTLREKIADDADMSSLDAFAASDIGEKRRLEAEIVEHEARRVEHEAEITRLTIALENAGAATGGGDKDAISALKSEIAALHRDRDRYAKENADLRSRAGSKRDGGEIERENAELRERISDLAANIAGLTAAADQNQAEIAKLVSDDKSEETDEGVTANPTLAARIRKLAKQPSSEDRGKLV